MTSTRGSLDWALQPPLLYPPYTSSVKRAPQQALVALEPNLSVLTGPVFGHSSLQELDNDLTRNAVQNGEPVGERIIVTGRVLDECGKPVPNALLEIWQANACGRYTHVNDQHPAPLDPNFTGSGRVVTDAQGRYKVTTIKPGAYPWPNGPNSWRPAHIHLSMFGTAFTSRLVTQMYFPGDPLFVLDPIAQSIPEFARLADSYSVQL